MRFFDRLQESISRLQSPCCVGIDPIIGEILPGYVPNTEDPQGHRDFCAEAIKRWGIDVIHQVYGVVPALKFQLAYFEQWGPAGMQVLSALTHLAHDADFLVILDGKRADIGPTSTAYAEAYLGPTGYYGDAMTVAPWMGTDSVEPFLARAVRDDKGLFVLVRTTNPGSAAIQLATLQDGRPVYELAADMVRGFNSRPEYHAAWTEAETYGPVGAVVGATDAKAATRLRELLTGAFFLVPGYGAQGGGLEAVAACFSADGTGAVVNSSRAVLYRKDGNIRQGATEFRNDVKAARSMRMGR